MAIKDVAGVEGVDIDSIVERAQMNPEETGHAFQTLQSPAGEAILQLLQTLKPHFPVSDHHTSPDG
jgi:hypothetical protein